MRKKKEKTLKEKQTSVFVPSNCWCVMGVDGPRSDLDNDDLEDETELTEGPFTGMHADCENGSDHVKEVMEESDQKLEKEEEATKAHSIFGLVAMVFFLVCGGAYGTEDLGGSIPPLYALAGILLIPWVLPPFPVVNRKKEGR